MTDGSWADAPDLHLVPDPSPAAEVAGLPAADGDLIGRAAPLAAATGLVGQAGLVTLTGPGGVGKTRLAVEVTARAASRFDAALFVPLSAASDAEQMLTSILRAGGWSAPPDRSLIRALADRVGGVRYLLVLDNLEQIAGTAPVLAEMTTACPELTILATSRIPLRATGEHIVAVEPLAIPDSADRRPPDIATNDSVTLLTQFARRAEPAFDVTAENADAIAGICAATDGLPLAIELAAARLRLVDPHELATLLDERLKVLRRRPGAEPRHDSLVATIDWSYRLLPADIQRRFERLGVFAGGFGLAGAAAVIETDTYDMLDTLDTLVDHSLVRVAADTAGSGRRFELLETIREYAAGRLDESPTRAEAARSAHADWCLAFAERLAPDLTGPGAAAALRHIDAEYPNLRTAMDWLLLTSDHGDERILRMTTSLHSYWLMRGAVPQGRRWLRRALEHHADHPNSAAMAAALDRSGHLARVDGDGSTARVHLETAATMWAALGDEVNAARSTSNLAVALTDIGEPDAAEPLQRESTAILEAAGDERGIGMAHIGLGLIAYLRGDLDDTTNCLDRAVIAFERVGDRFQIAVTTGYLGATRTAQGQLGAAVEDHTRAIGLAREFGHVLIIEHNLTNLAAALTELGRFDEAEAALDEALAMIGNAATLNRAMATCNRGRLELARGRPAAAGHWLAASLQQFGELDLMAGRVVVLELFGILATRSGHPLDAISFLAAGERIRHDAGSVPVGTDADAIRTCRALAEGAVPPEDAAAAAATGRAWSHPEAIAAAQRLAATLESSGVDMPAGSDPLEALGLTRRQAEVARLLAARMTDREIAEQLFIGIRTVGTHVSAVLRKLGVSSRREVADKLMAAGF